MLAKLGQKLRAGHQVPMPGAGVFSELMWNSRNVSASAFLGRGHAVGAVDGCGSSPLKGGRCGVAFA